MEEARRRLYQQIREWNEHRLDLFALSEPNQDLEFFGVMRFYYQDETQDLGEKVSTKCIRVSSTASVRDVLATLVEKFRPDIRMLTASDYALYEIHTNEPERRLQDWECPLLVQLNWGKDDREGRILMKSTRVISGSDTMTSTSSKKKLGRKLSKREKKDQKKKEEDAKKRDSSSGALDLASSLYNELPDSVLTRSISNPEMVMRKRRQLKLEKKLNQIRTSDGGPESGGTLKIYGDTICADVPYKTLLLSERDRATDVVKETLEKYGLEKDDPADYCLIQVVGPHPSQVDEFYAGASRQEYVLDDNDCPLQLLIHAPMNQGQMTFHIRRRTNAMRKSRSDTNMNRLGQAKELPPGAPLHAVPARVGLPYTSLREDQLPYLLEINADGVEIRDAQLFVVPLNGLELGRERCSPPGVSHLLLRGNGMCPRHCVLRYTETAVTLTPLNADAAVSINGVRVFDTIILRHADIIHLGGGSYFLRYIDPMTQAARNSSPMGGQMLQEGRAVQTFSTMPEEQLPYLLEINGDGTPIKNAQIFKLPLNGLELGSDRAAPPGVSHLLLRGNDMCPRHCVLRFSDTAVTLTPLDNNAAITVNGRPVFGVTPLRHGDIVLLGIAHYLRYVEPMASQRLGSSSNQPVRTAEEVSLLPATVEHRDDTEDRFLSAILTESAVIAPFKLTATYVIYMAARYLVHSGKRPQLQRFVAKSSSAMFQIVQRQSGNPQGLSLWMANCSELLNFFGRDREMSAVSTDACNQLASGVQLAFRALVDVLEADLDQLMPAFLDPRPDPGETDEGTMRRLRPVGSGPTIGDVVDMLGSVINFLLRARVNAALTIQLFSHLFHHMNQWLFNRLIQSASTPESRQSLCTRDWGRRLVRRLHEVEVWAERQGLELAADCHLARVVQAAKLLQSSKASSDDIADFCTTCYKLNSIQIRVLLQNYVAAPNEPRISPDLITRAVLIAQNTADETARNEGQEIKLLEDPELNLPFLFPEDGYSCEFIHGLPNELVTFLQPLVKAGLCRLVPGQNSAELWTVYFDATDVNVTGKFHAVPLDTVDSRMPQTMQPPVQRTPEVNVITFRKVKNSLGLSIVAAVAAGRAEQRIYVKSVVPGGAAELDGRITAGDLLLEVDGRSLIGLSQEAAADVMKQTGQVVTLKVVHQGAVYDGLAMILNQPVASTMPPQQRSAAGYPQSNGKPYTPKPADSTLTPAGGHYSKVNNLSKSNPNLEKAPEYVIRPAVTSVDSYGVGNNTKKYPSGVSTNQPYGGRKPSPQQSDGYERPAYANVQLRAPGNNTGNGVNRLSAISNKGNGPQYPYGGSQSSYQSERDGRNAQYQGPALQQQPQVTQMPRSSVSRPYPNQPLPNQQHSPPYQTMPYSATSASQPNLSQNNMDGNIQETIISGANNPKYPYMGGPAQSQSGQVRSQPNPVPQQQQMRGPSVGYDQAMDDRTLNEPQYAKVAPRGPRSQSVPRNPLLSSSTVELSTRQSSSPWEREERENEQKQADIEKRRHRDAEIAALESRMQQLSIGDYERLRRLKLEADFDRRLEEENNREYRRSGINGAIDHEADAGRATLMRQIQDEAARYQYEQQAQQNRTQEKQSDAWRQPRDTTGTRRDLNPALQRGLNGGRPIQAPPQPPERKSSFDGYRPTGVSIGTLNNGNGVELWTPSMPSNNAGSMGLNKKSVSFTPSASESTVPQPLPVAGRQQTGYPYSEKSTNFRNPTFGVSDIPMPVFTTPDGGGPQYNRQNSSSGGPRTPGVVGAQEIYPDPHDRRMAANQGPMDQNTPVPERMSFRDKMRHFAAEAGEDTPEERMKNSRAQRMLEAETNGGY